MANVKFLCVGDSVAAGAFCSSPEYTLQHQLLTMLRSNYRQHWFNDLAPAPSGSNARMGGIWAIYNQYREMNPDIVVLGGIGDNDSSSSITSITSSISSSAKTIPFSSAPSTGRAYILTDGTNTEVVIPQGVSSSKGTMCIRGAMGTVARNWPTGSTVLSWTARGQEAWTLTLRMIIEDIARKDKPYLPIVLVGGQVFEAASTGAGSLATEALVAQLQAEGYEAVEYCPYATVDDTDLFSPNTTTDYCGPSALLTAQLGADGLTAAVSRSSEFNAGDYLLLAATGVAEPGFFTSQVVKVSSVPGPTGVVFASPRPQLGATSGAVTSQTFGTGSRLCRMSVTSLGPRHYWDYMGGSGGETGGFYAGGWAYDYHPNDMGFSEIAKSFFRGYERVIARIGDRF